MSVLAALEPPKGRLEFLADRRGIYGLTWPNPSFSDQPPKTYILRPDRLEDGDAYCAATLHPLPRRPGMFRHTAEYFLRTELAQNLLRQAGLEGLPDGAFTDKALRQRYWGLRQRAATISNGLIARLIEEAADPEALRIARRYPPAIRMGVYCMAATEPRLRQLCETFPAAATLVAVGSGSRGTQVRAAAIRGARLSEIAEGLSWPLAFRKIPPGAVINLLNVEGFLQSRPELIHDMMPSTLPAIRRWLAAIHWASRLGGPFVEWTARTAPEMGRTMLEVNTVLTDARDWVRASYANELGDVPEHILRAVAGVVLNDRREVGAHLVGRRFHPSMSLETVLHLSDEWHQAVATAQPDGKEVIFPPPWHPAGEADGYQVVPIETGADLWQEGRAMRHCAATWQGVIRSGDSYLYSIRKEGERIATAELRRYGDKVKLGQVRGHCNARPEKPVMAAVRKWLRKQGAPTFPPPPQPVPHRDLDLDFPF